jgi:Methyl-accepting chemotaxis protein (MCP) signalling domain
MNMDTQTQLTKLLKLGAIGLSVMALVSISVLGVLKYKVNQVIRFATPAQIQMTQLKADLDMVVSLALQLGQSESSGALQTLSFKLSEVTRRLEKVEEKDFLSEPLKKGVRELLPILNELKELAGKRNAHAQKALTSVQTMRQAVATMHSNLENAANQSDPIGDEAQRKLVSARESSLQANRLIHHALSMREKLALFEVAVQKIALVEKRFKLSPLRETTGALLDNIQSLDLKALKMLEPFKAFKGVADTVLLGEKGLFALRSESFKKNRSVLDDEAFSFKSKELSDALQQIGAELGKRIDPLQLQVAQESKAMTDAVTSMSAVKNLNSSTASIFMNVEQLAIESESMLTDREEVSLSTHETSLQKKLGAVHTQLKTQTAILNGLKREFSGAAKASLSVQKAVDAVAVLKRSLLGEEGALKALRNADSHRDLFEVSLKSMLVHHEQTQKGVTGYLDKASTTQASSAAELFSLTRFTPILLLALCLVVAFYGRKRGKAIIASVLLAENERQGLLAKQKLLFESVVAKARDLKGEILGLQTLSSGLDSQAHRTLQQAQGSLSDSRQISATSQDTVQRIEGLSQEARHISQDISLAASRMKEAVFSCSHARAQAQSLHEASGKVGSILHFISGLAEQIHILSLNASIEAKRAGTAGRGFAVLAQEVRELAKKTAQSTQSIQSTISGVQTGIQSVMQGIGQIDEVVTEVDAIQTKVAASASHQQDTTQTVSGTVALSAEGSGKMATAFEVVAQAAGQTSDVAAQTRHTAARLETMVTELANLAQS